MVTQQITRIAKTFWENVASDHTTPPRKVIFGDYAGELTKQEHKALISKRSKFAFLVLPNVAQLGVLLILYCCSCGIVSFPEEEITAMEDVINLLQTVVSASTTTNIPALHEQLAEPDDGEKRATDLVFESF